jgi:hypothetical protein
MVEKATRQGYKNATTGKPFSKGGSTKESSKSKGSKSSKKD